MVLVTNVPRFSIVCALADARDGPHVRENMSESSVTVGMAVEILFVC